MKMRRFRRAALVVWLALAPGLFVPAARADEKAVLAQEAFDSAMKLAKLGRYAEACPRFEESLKLDEQIGTLFYLADCQEHMEFWASAWANFLGAADKAAAINKQGHAAEARARADALKVRLNKLLIVLPDEIRNMDGVEIRKGDLVLGPSQLGVAFPVDNGKHEIKVSATGRRAWSTTVTIAGESSTTTVTVPFLQEEPVVGPVATATPTSVPVTAPPADMGWSKPRKAAVALGAVGVAGLVMGGVFGGLAADKVSTSNQLCAKGSGGAPDKCPPEGAGLRDEANTFANVANVGVIAGATLAAAGVVVWLVAPAADKPAGAKGKSRIAIVAAPQGAFINIGREW